MDDHLMLACLEIKPGLEDTGHGHPFDPCRFVLKGQLEMFIDQAGKILQPKGAHFIASCKRHGSKRFNHTVKLSDVSKKSKLKKFL